MAEISNLSQLNERIATRLQMERLMVDHQLKRLVEVPPDAALLAQRMVDIDKELDEMGWVPGWVRKVV